jgi:glycosyltransferase involved in cell wall biosynthesis
MKHILLLTPGQPSTNPRLVKEAKSLDAAGYHVTVLYGHCANWADSYDELIINANPNIEWIQAAGNPDNKKFTYYLSKVSFRIFSFLSNLLPQSIAINTLSINRASFFLKQTAMHIKADVYRAHSLCTLAIAVKAAAKNKAKASIDFEDHFSGQWTEHSKHYNIAKKLEDHFIPGIQFSTSASPLIHAAYARQYQLNDIVVNNVFSSMFAVDVVQPFVNGDVLKLFWFSQTIGPGRGIEEVIEAMGSTNDKKLQLTLLGSCSNDMKAHFLSIAKRSGLEVSQINFIKATSEAELFNIASQHHIGLALEINDTLNRRICLTNKLFTYLLSGLAVIATDTPAQKLFISSYPGIGKCYEQGEVSKLAAILKYHLENPDALNGQRLAALELGKNRFNWENESPALMDFFRSNLAS